MVNISAMTEIKKVVNSINISHYNDKYCIALVNRGTAYEPYVVCCGYHQVIDNGKIYAYWGHGHYFQNLEDAQKLFKKIIIKEIDFYFR